METNVGRDIVVVAASAGGIEALRELLSGLPADLPAAILVVLHVPATGGRSLPHILDRAGPLKAAAAENDEPLRHGRVYVAPADHHILLSDGVIRVSHGPLRNGHRPAADPLFISAAIGGGPRVLGVVLSGTLDDGATGAAFIEAHGGLVVVQDPAETVYSGMPSAALAATTNAVTLPVGKIAAFIDEQSRTPAPSGDPVPERWESGEVLPLLSPDFTAAVPPGDWSGLTCPDCGGPLQRRRDAAGERYRCRVGHGWSAATLAERQSSTVERALWVATLRLDERVRLSRRMAEEAAGRGHSFSAERFRDQAAEAEEALRTIRGLLEHATANDVTDEDETVP